MRFLHTSDWHIGKPLRNLRRDAEYAAVLAEVADIARREKVDCVLIAGDVFDSVAPPPEAERMVFDFFRELIAEKIPAVVIAGNHDHPRRLNAFSRVLDLVNVHVRGEPVVADEGGIIEVSSRDGSETAVIAALPWVSERKVRDFASLMTGGAQFEQYAEGVAEMIAHLCAQFRPDTVNVLLSHVFLSGAVVEQGSGERALHVGDVYAITPQRIPPSVQYAALGHIHKPQDLPLSNAHYCGSLLQCDFGEAGQEKGVNIVDVKPGAKARVERIAFTTTRQLVNVPAHKEGITLAEIKEMADEIDPDAYLKVFLKVDAPVPGLSGQVRDLLPNAVEIMIQRPARSDEHRHESLAGKTPPELFGEYYRETHDGAEPDKELAALFNRVYEDVSG